MAQHPEMYTAEELAKHGVAYDPSSRPPAELETPANDVEGPEGITALPSLRSRHTLSRDVAGISELEAKEKTLEDKLAKEIEHEEFYALAREHAQSQVNLSRASSPNSNNQHPAQLQPATYVPTGNKKKHQQQPQHQQQTQSQSNQPQRLEIPSMCETEFEEDGDWVSTYSGEDEHCSEATASPMVQVRFRNTIDSIMSLYNEKNGGVLY